MNRSRIGMPLLIAILAAVVLALCALGKIDITYNTRDHTVQLTEHEVSLHMADQTTKLQLEIDKLAEDVRQEAASNSALGSLAKSADELARHARTAADEAAKSLAKTSPDAQEASDGWLYLGKVDGDRWDGRAHIGATTPSVSFQQGYLVEGDSFLRKDQSPPTQPAPTGWRRQQALIGVLKSGTKVIIEKTELDSAVDGGTAMWALVKPVG